MARRARKVPPIPPEYEPMRKAATDAGTTYWIVRGLVKSGKIRWMTYPGRGYGGQQWYVHTGDLREVLQRNAQIKGNPPAPQTPPSTDEGQTREE